ncbi:MAG: TIGR03084 family metal-binding protein [Desulfovibrionales bacterium]|nr:TIGR03084 family metal-binding protein [Desulfovibrionales bacterium]
MDTITHDLAWEQSDLEDILISLDEDAWKKVTPFAQWTIKDQVAHLTYFDRAARLSIQDPKGFEAEARALLESHSDFEHIHDAINARGSRLPGVELLARWKEERLALLQAYQTVDAKARLPWYSQAMGARSSATARLMEAWAHGEDIRECLGEESSETHRLKHIVHLGVATFGWSFMVRKQVIPSEAVFVKLLGPGDEVWTFNPDPGGEPFIEGRALDFCRVVTQRRHFSDTKLLVKGETARQWMEYAQAFAGPPEQGPSPGERQ